MKCVSQCIHHFDWKTKAQSASSFQITNKQAINGLLKDCYLVSIIGSDFILLWRKSSKCDLNWFYVCTCDLVCLQKGVYLTCVRQSSAIRQFLLHWKQWCNTTDYGQYKNHTGHPSICVSIWCKFYYSM